MTEKTLLLFDIDGTILTVHDPERQAILETFSDVFQQPIQLPYHSFSGKTDWEIFRDTLHPYGLHEHFTGEKWDEFKKLYTLRAKKSLHPKQVVFHPGIQETMAWLQTHSQFVSGLLTGNIREMAYHKLSFLNIDHLFPLGAFGDDHWSREELGKVATDRFSQSFPGYKLKQVVIIGDSPRDIQTAKYMDAKCIAVTTGRYSSEELAPFHPDYIVSSMIEIPDILMSW